MRLFHFSDDPSIARFTPRPVQTATARPPGREWLNGPLVWAIDDWHHPMYLFPRDCPRILVWTTSETTEADRRRIWRGSSARMIAFIEDAQAPTLANASLYRYELPTAQFRSLDDAGMWVSEAEITPTALELIKDLPRALAAAEVELRCLETLNPLRDLWETSLHVSGIRLRNAADWK